MNTKTNRNKIVITCVLTTLLMLTAHLNVAADSPVLTDDVIISIPNCQGKILVEVINEGNDSIKVEVNISTKYLFRSNENMVENSRKTLKPHSNFTCEFVCEEIMFCPSLVVSVETPDKNLTAIGFVIFGCALYLLRIPS